MARCTSPLAFQIKLADCQRFIFFFKNLGRTLHWLFSLQSCEYWLWQDYQSKGVIIFHTRIVSCRRRLAPRFYRRKCQHVQSRLDLARRFATLRACLQRDAANISYNIGFQRNASLMIRLRSTDCLHGDLAIKSSQTYNINLLDVALIACSIFMLPVALITESVQHLHPIERRWQITLLRRCWAHQTFLVRKWGISCIFMGGHVSKYWARPISTALRAWPKPRKCRRCETAKWQTMRIQYGYRWSRGLHCSLLCSGRERVVRRGIGFRLNFHHLQGTLRIKNPVKYCKVRLTHQDSCFNAACSPAQLQVFLFPWSCTLWHLVETS